MLTLYHSGYVVAVGAVVATVALVWWQQSRKPKKLIALDPTAKIPFKLVEKIVRIL